MKNLLCRVGQDAWADKATNAGALYRDCRRCRAIKDDERRRISALTAITPGVVERVAPLTFEDDDLRLPVGSNPTASSRDPRVAERASLRRDPAPLVYRICR